MNSRRMRWAELVARMTIANKVGVEKPEGKKRPRIRWEDSSQMDHNTMKIWAQIIWLRNGIGSSNKAEGYTNDVEFLDQQSDCHC
jgi:hypothetical protein